MDVVVVEVEAEVVVMVTRMAGANTMNPDTIRETIITLGGGEDDLAVLPCTTTIMEEGLTVVMHRLQVFTRVLILSFLFVLLRKVALI